MKQKQTQNFRHNLKANKDVAKILFREIVRTKFTLKPRDKNYSLHECQQMNALYIVKNSVWVMYTMHANN